MPDVPRASCCCRVVVIVSSSALICLAILTHTLFTKPILQIEQTQTTYESAINDISDVNVRPYSNYTCVGDLAGVWKGKRLIQKIRCSFHNVCYNLDRDDKTLVYFAKSTDRNASHVPTSFEHNFVQMKVLREAIPVDKAVFQHEAFILIVLYRCANFGHVLRDILFYVYSLQQLDSIADPFDTQILSLPHMACIRTLADMLATVSRKAVLSFRTKFWSKLLAGVHGENTRKPTWMCFDKLLTGTGPHDVGKFFPRHQDYYILQYPYRNHIVKNLLGPDCPDVACGRALPRCNHIVFLRKKLFMKPDRRGRVGTGPGILNTYQLQQHTKKLHPDYDVSSLDLSRLSFKSQVELMIQTAVLFSHGGGGSFVALFLPPGSSFAFMAKLEGEFLYYRNLTWITTYRLPDVAYGAGLTLDVGIADHIVQTALNGSSSCML